ncbi:MAG: carboxypeptidase-like regulatory domain-containing protein, partial [Acidobacteriota bacterium]
MHRSTAAVILLTSLAWLGGVPAASALEVTGQVLDEQGRPIEGADVDLILEPSAFEAARVSLVGGLGGDVVDAAATTGDGWFTLTAPSAGFYRVRVDVDGYAPVANPLHPLIEARTLHPLRLRPAAPLRLTLVGKDGAPLEGGWVRMNWCRYSPGPWDGGAIIRRGWRPAWRTAVSGPGGLAQLPVVAGETVSIEAGHGDLTLLRTVRGAGAPVRLVLRALAERTVRIVDADGRPASVLVDVTGEPPAYTDADGVVSLHAHLDGGQELELVTPGGLRHRTPWRGEAEIRLPAVEPLRGRVVDAGDGAALADAFLWRSGETPRWTVSRRGGVFEWSAFAGADPNLGLRAAAYGYRETPVHGLEETALTPVRMIRGRVLDGNGAPIGGVEVHVDAENIGRTSSRSPSTVSGPDGRFRYSAANVTQTYSLRAHLPSRPPAVALAAPGV